MAQLLEERPGIVASEETLSAALPLWQEPLPAPSRTLLVAQTATRRLRMDWAELGMLLLLVACAALGVYRLAWAMRP